MISVKEKLRGLVPASGLKPEPVLNKETSISLMVPGLDAQVVTNNSGSFLLREKRFPVDFNHGGLLKEFLTLQGTDFIYAGKNPQLAVIQPEQVLFIDTETTGLAGGAGTYAFLVGIGFFENGEFIVQQFFMRDYSDEPALLEALNHLLTGRAALLSYNGKAYDIPLLKTRCIMNRNTLYWDDFLHLDLLHAARRLWRKTLPACSLQNIEQSILGFRRQGDIPGAEIPYMYFAYLRSRDIKPLLPVFRHNVMDILSMVSITVKVCRAFSEWEKLQYEHYDLFAIVKTFEELGRHELASQACSAFIGFEAHPDLIQFMLKNAMLMKKMQRFEEAETLWQQVIDRAAWFVPEPWEELAKYYEHRRRDYAMALDIVERAEKRLEISLELHGNNDPAVYEAFVCRKQRLLKKQNRFLSGDQP
ncbi:MAG TPA: ribonuclease H-like domain-containing protein [bacterium]|nr:ribonuclease H-like domain-containing protein [bacterium]HPN43344.1 ribonuclease H-like domain-containing protein [bacterium]